MDCHTASQPFTQRESGSTIALVGHQNVGKSVLFQLLTGHHATVSNYPGTTVDITSGKSQYLDGVDVIDTPGLIGLPPRSDDERVTARVLFDEDLRTVIQVGDAKNLRRTLLLTIQLAEMELPLVMALNMMDEAGERGMKVDHDRLAAFLDIPVIPTIAVKGEGLSELNQAVSNPPLAHLHFDYPSEIEAAIADMVPYLPKSHLAPRAVALLYLCRDETTEAYLQEKLPPLDLQSLSSRRETLQLSFVTPLSTVIQQVRLDFADKIASSVILESGTQPRGLASWLSHTSSHPLWGIPILAVVLFSLYAFVGLLGAGTLVDLLESGLFGEIINPWVSTQIARLLPIDLLVDLIVGKYGLWTMGMTYALALILPIVTTFFLAFSLLEDSGYLPRLAVMTNRLFRLIGLNGKAVLPMVLGLGCVTMATLTTRILESRRDRLLVILLLALAVPCSAQLGVVMGLLAGVSLTATLIWFAFVLAVFVVVGYLAAKLVPGQRTSLLLELPPMRLPIFSNVITKTLARLEWYTREVVPLFLMGSAVMFTLDRTGLLEWIIATAEPLVAGWLGLPAEASAAFILGFLRRDFGATGLFVMESQGLLSPLQVVVAMVTITLFVPCIASVFMIAKERGWRTSLAMLALIFPLAFIAGGLLNKVLLAIGWGI